MTEPAQPGARVPDARMRLRATLAELRAERLRHGEQDDSYKIELLCSAVEQVADALDEVHVALDPLGEMARRAGIDR